MASEVTRPLSWLFKKLENLDIDYCLLHSHRNLSERVESDIDIVIDYRGIEQIDEILNEMAHVLGWKIIQKIVHKHTSAFYILTRITDEEVLFLGLDFSTDFWMDGARLFKAEELLENRRIYRNFYVALPHIEGCYTLLKKILKEEIDTKQMETLKFFYLNTSKEFDQLLSRYLGNRTATHIIHLISEGNVDQFNKHAPKFKREILLRHYRKNPLHVIKHWTRKFAWIIQRLLYPPGIVVALIGPDGCGKSFVSKNVLAKPPKYAFNKMHLHWRPGLLPMASEFIRKRDYVANDFTQPHKNAPYWFPLSFVRLLYYTVDYILGYYFKVLPAKIKYTLVVFDRYYFDFLVDQRRYRMNLPNWIPIAFMKIVPKPDVTVYLHAPVDILRSRKQELSDIELERQAKEFNSLLPKIKNVHRIDAGKPIQWVVKDVWTIVRDELEKRHVKEEPQYSQNHRR